MTPTPSAREPQARTHLTCERCGLADATVKKQHVYTGCASDRPTPFYEIHNLHQSDDERDACIDAMRAAYDALAAEREALAKDAAIVANARRDRLVLVPTSPELLAMDVFTDRPLHVKLTANDDGTHMLTFRESDALAAAERERDALRGSQTGRSLTSIP